MPMIRRLSMIAVTAAAVVLAGGPSALAHTTPTNSALAASVRPRLHIAPRPYDNVSCASKSFCLAVDASAQTWTEYNGKSWSKARRFSKALRRAFGNLAGPRISCPSDTYCVGAQGTSIARFTHKGWGKPRHVVPSSVYLDDISCASRSDCKAVGATDRYDLVVSWNGKDWSHPRKVLPLNDNRGNPRVSCVAGLCAVVDGDAAVVLRHTRSSTQKLRRIYQAISVSCLSRTYCAAVDYNGNDLTFNGTKWLTHAVDPNTYFNAVSCASKRFCLLVGDKIPHPDARILSGRKTFAPWNVHHTPRGTNTLAAVSCVSTSWCMAVAHYVQHA